MDKPLSLRDHLLVAMPELHGGLFERTVIYVCEHQPEGAVGLIINQPLPYHLSFIFQQLQIDFEHAKQTDQALLWGGPMQPERGFVIHRPGGNWRSSLILSDDVTITTSNDIIRALARNEGPSKVLVALGFVAWGPQQLDQEIEEKWLVCPYTSHLLYDMPFDKRWEKAALGIGVNLNQLVGKAGHA